MTRGVTPDDDRRDAARRVRAPARARHHARRRHRRGARRRPHVRPRRARPRAATRRDLRPRDDKSPRAPSRGGRTPRARPRKSLAHRRGSEVLRANGRDASRARGPSSLAAAPRRECARACQPRDRPYLFDPSDGSRTVNSRGSWRRYQSNNGSERGHLGRGLHSWRTPTFCSHSAGRACCLPRRRRPVGRRFRRWMWTFDAR